MTYRQNYCLRDHVRLMHVRNHVRQHVIQDIQLILSAVMEYKLYQHNLYNGQIPLGRTPNFGIFDIPNFKGPFTNLCSSLPLMPNKNRGPLDHGLVHGPAWIDHQNVSDEKRLIIPTKIVRQKSYFYRKYQVKIPMKMTVPEARIAIDFQEFIFKSLLVFVRFRNTFDQSFGLDRVFFSPGQMLNSRSLQRVFSAESFVIRILQS